MDYLSLFSMPTPMKITGRSSSITNAFINSIIPVVLPSADEVKQALEILGMTADTFQCAYCGGVASEWDHLRPLVKHKKPTGYISEIHNLVPSCGKCNQSKGNKEWKVWMLGTAKLSPTARGIKDITERVKRLQAYESSKAPTQMDFAAIVGIDVWSQHQNNLERVQSLLRESQALAAKINAEVAQAYKSL
jgi:HNH endonuclease